MLAVIKGSSVENGRLRVRIHLQLTSAASTPSLKSLVMFRFGLERLISSTHAYSFWRSLSFSAACMVHVNTKVLQVLLATSASSLVSSQMSHDDVMRCDYLVPYFSLKRARHVKRAESRGAIPTAYSMGNFLKINGGISLLYFTRISDVVSQPCQSIILFVLYTIACYHQESSASQHVIYTRSNMPNYYYVHIYICSIMYVVAYEL